MKTIEKKLLTLLVLLISVTMTFGQSNARELQDLIGAKGSSAEYELENRGYVHIKTDKSSSDVYSYWWNWQNKKCVSYHMQDGRIQSVVNSMPYDCNKSTTGNGYNSYSHQAHHHDNNTHYKNKSHVGVFERGFNDGLHNKSYHNSYDNAQTRDVYADGYGKGVAQRNKNTSYHSGRGGYGSYAQVNDIKGLSVDAAAQRLTSRGFTQIKQHKHDGKTHRYFYNKNTDQCIETISMHGKTGTVQKSNNCKY